MYALLQYRFSTAVQNCIEILDQMTPMTGGNGGKTAIRRAKTPTATRSQTPSVASSPSLRSKTPILVEQLDHRINVTPGGNVKVVVRVRGFLPRGMVHNEIVY
jgi:citrate lyase alpha subunit